MELEKEIELRKLIKIAFFTIKKIEKDLIKINENLEKNKLPK